MPVVTKDGTPVYRVRVGMRHGEPGRAVAEGLEAAKAVLAEF